MGKSNKFDYTNRSNSGPKLGQIIGAALQKESDKIQKDAEKAASKPTRKQSLSNPSSSTAAGVSPVATHTLDLRAPSKELTDEGVSALVEGLKIALESGAGQARLVLEELNLAGNSLTTEGLVHLTPVVRRASASLRGINLAENRIRVVDDEDAERWEGFLRAFEGCSKLRRLDLSGNVELGPRALEILARVHDREWYVDPALHDARGPAMFSRRHEREADDSSSDHDSSTAQSAQVPLSTGLHSIAYITLNNIGLEDAGALWLSYLLENHPYPKDVNDRGVDWNDNNALGKDGRLLLDKAESVRRQTVANNQVNNVAGGDVDSMLDRDNESDRRKSGDQKSGKAKQETRRVSIKSPRNLESGEHEIGEVDSIRKRLKRQIIVHSGTTSVELWRSTLILLRVSRLLERLAPIEFRKYSTHAQVAHSEEFITFTAKDSPTTLVPTRVDSSVLPELEHLSLNTSQTPTHDRNPPPLTYKEKLEVAESLTLMTEQQVDHLTAIITQNCAEYRDMETLELDVNDLPDDVQVMMLEYVRSVFGPAEPTTPKAGEDGVGGQVLTDVTNTPETPLLAQRGMQRKDAFSEGVDRDDGERRFKGQRQFGEYQQMIISERKEKTGLGFRNHSAPSHLPRDVIERIARCFLSERELQVLSPRQRDEVVRWGSDRATMQTEIEWHKKDESVQVLMLLDCLGCLAHGPGA